MLGVVFERLFSALSKHLRHITLSTDEHLLPCFQVFSFNDEEERESFVLRCSEFLKGRGLSVRAYDVSFNEMMQSAKTKERRDEELQKFFKAAISVVSTLLFSCYQLLGR